MPRPLVDAGKIEPSVTPPSWNPRRALKRLRAAAGRPLDRWLAGSGLMTIISDDCWGGEYDRAAGRAYTTPLAGAFVIPGDYLTFLENFHAPDAFQLRRLASPHAYPVGHTPYATIHFMHAATWEQAAAAFARRAARMNRSRLFFKIDFGKAGYTQQDVVRWNRLNLRRAIALVPPTSRLGFDFSRVHQGWRVPVWTYDGAAMFHLSRRSFNFHHWLRTSELRNVGWTRYLNLIFWDPLVPSEIKWKLRSLFFGPERSPRRLLEQEDAPVRARRMGPAILP